MDVAGQRMRRGRWWSIGHGVLTSTNGMNVPEKGVVLWMRVKEANPPVVELSCLTSWLRVAMMPYRSDQRQPSQPTPAGERAALRLTLVCLPERRAGASKCASAVPGRQTLPTSCSVRSRVP